jgi:hypothetical protein
MSRATESIFSGKTVLVPMAEVQHVEKLVRKNRPTDTEIIPNGLHLVTKHTNYNFHQDMWDNPIYIPESEAAEFLKAWQLYRSEIDDIDEGP